LLGGIDRFEAVEMGFLSPLMLFGAAAVSVPIILHFFFRSRYRLVPWAAMKFLLTSIEQTSRRLKFQELLLLVLRCLVLAVLALAMARPTTTAARGTGRGDAVDAVFLMDVSYSMGAADGSISRLERAKLAAIEILDKLPPHSTVQIVASSDRAEVLGPRSPSNLDQGRQLIHNLELTSLATDFAPGVVEAKSIFDRGQLPNKELYLFSDMQKSGWEQQASGLISDFKELKDRAGLFLVRCGGRTPKNAAIVGITPQAGVPRPGERVGFAVLVRNTGTEELRDVVISLTSDTSAKGEDKEKTETQTLPFLQAGETRAVTLAGKFEKAGPRVLTARIKFDDVPGDNRFDQIVPVRETVNVLVVNGKVGEREPQKSPTYFLNHALLPVKDIDRPKHFLQLREVEPRLASPALLAKTDLVFLVNAGVADKQLGGAARNTLPADFINELNNWVRQGHGLVIIPGDNTQADAYNRGLGSLLPMPIAKFRTYDAKARGLFFDRGTFSLAAFSQFRDDRYFARINDIQTHKMLELTEPKDDSKSGSETILRYDNGWPALARKRIEGGEVILATHAFEPTWTDWPFAVEFTPFVQTLFAHLLQQQTQNMNLQVGQAVTWYPQDKEPRNYNLQTPGGEQLRLGVPVVKDKRQILGLPILTHGGVYRLLPRAATQDVAVAGVGVPIAVVPDLRESQSFDTLSDPQIDARLGFAPTHITAGAELTGTGGFDRFQREWTLWVLALVLLLAVGESWLAWICGRAW
jgi:hypothetical protein